MRILVVDDDAMLRRLLADRLRRSIAGATVHEADDGCAALTLAGSERPDVVLLDLCLAGEDGATLIRPILAVSPATRIIVITGMRDEQWQIRAIRAGARGLIQKYAPSDVVPVIERVMKDGHYIDPALVLRAPGEGDQPRLTPREEEVLSVFSRTGGSNKEIAKRLGKSARTVRNHLSSICKKFGVPDRTALLFVRLSCPDGLGPS